MIYSGLILRTLDLIAPFIRRRYVKGCPSIANFESLGLLLKLVKRGGLFALAS